MLTFPQNKYKMFKGKSHLDMSNQSTAVRSAHTRPHNFMKITDSYMIAGNTTKGLAETAHVFKVVI